MKIAISLAAVLLFGSAAMAVELLGDPPDPQRVESGRAVAAGAGGEGMQGACFRCHGADGAGQAAAGFPALAGQSANYLFGQMQAFASGARQNQIMSGIAAALTEAQRRDVAVYYASLPPSAPAARPQGDPALMQQGGLLSAIGSAERGVQACQNCHGPAGIGITPLYPRLSGQPQVYLAARLRGWQGSNDAANVMVQIARRLSEEDIRAAALYFASTQVTGTAP